MTQQNWFLISGVLGFLGVALGAFGAHGLKKMLSDEMMQVYQTGVLYHLIHTVALLTITIYNKMPYAQICFLVGILIFSGSLYILTISGMKKLGMVTPIGGLFFLAGWFFVIWEGMKNA